MTATRPSAAWRPRSSLITSKISAGKSSIKALRTIDRLLAEGWFTRTSVWAAIAEYTIDGRRLGAQPYAFTSESRHETRLEQKQSETFLLAHALVDLGYRDVALQSRESPDFRVTFPAGAGAVGIEVAELVEPESARWRNAIENVRVGIRDVIDADPNLQAAIAGRYVSLSLWHCPTAPPSVGWFPRSASYSAATRCPLNATGIALSTADFQRSPSIGRICS